MTQRCPACGARRWLRLNRCRRCSAILVAPGQPWDDTEPGDRVFLRSDGAWYEMTEVED